MTRFTEVLIVTDAHATHPLVVGELSARLDVRYSDDPNQITIHAPEGTDLMRLRVDVSELLDQVAATTQR